jgi:polar amino acid transport system substrate-binding protein
MRLLSCARVLLLIPTVLLAACATAPAKEVAPGGTLRVGIGVGPVPSAFWATRDPASGEPRGVTVELAKAMAKDLGLSLRLVAYANSGEVTAGGPKGEWDVAFMPMDDVRARMVDFGSAYYLTESTYLVAAGSPIRALADVDRPGVRVAGVEGTTTARSAARSLKNNTVKTYRTADELLELMRTGGADAIALGRESLSGMQAKLPGSRILDGHFQATGTAVAVPKGRPAALAYVTAFVERAKKDGTVRKALDSAGLKDSPVALTP